LRFSCIGCLIAGFSRQGQVISSGGPIVEVFFKPNKRIVSNDAMTIIPTLTY